jgi:hypothetical protein
MNNYLALCEILYNLIMGENGDRNLSFKIVHPEVPGVSSDDNKNKVEIHLMYEVHEFLNIDDHFSEKSKDHVEFKGRGYAFDINDPFAVKHFLYALAEKYILWEDGGEDEYGNKTENWASEDYYKEDLKDPRNTSTYRMIKMINRKIRCKMSWKDFQNQKLLNSFVNK